MLGKPLCIEPPPFCYLGVSVLANRGLFPACGVPRSHAFPLPSSFCCERGGWSNLIALGGEPEEEGLCISFGHSRTWVGKQVPGSKATELAFARPRCKAPAPSVVACQRVGVVWGMRARAQRLSSAPCCPTGNDLQLVPSLSRAHRRLTMRACSVGAARCWQCPSTWECFYSLLQTLNIYIYIKI